MRYIDSLSLFLPAVIYLGTGGIVVQSNEEGDACTRASDVEYWRTGGGFFEFRTQLRDCGIDTLVSLLDPTKMAECLGEEGMPYTFDCRFCFGALAQCTYEECGQCFFDQTSESCETCAEQTCNPVFFDCGGDEMNPTECPGCTAPLVSIIPGLEDKYFFIIIAALIVIVLASGAYYVLYKCKVDYEDEYEQELTKFETPKKTSNLYSKNAMYSPKTDGTSKSSSKLSKVKALNLDETRLDADLKNDFDFDGAESAAPSYFYSSNDARAPNKTVPPPVTPRSPKRTPDSPVGLPPGFRLLDDDYLKSNDVPYSEV